VAAPSKRANCSDSVSGGRGMAAKLLMKLGDSALLASAGSY
jgi:hypothetical protein